MSLDDLIEKYTLRKINSMTKYPSIETYHTIDRGKLLPELTNGEEFIVSEDNPLLMTEKIDGTNSRIVVYKGDWLIGGREEFLSSKGDRVYVTDHSVVDTVRETADRIAEQLKDREELFVFFGEVYGGRVGSQAKNYSNNRDVTDFRVFDVIEMPPEMIHEVLNLELSKIATWRDTQKKQPFLNCLDEGILTVDLKLETVVTLNSMGMYDGDCPPLGIEETYQWLLRFEKTKCGIDNNDEGKSEGVIVRNFDRSLIRKIRFEDYEKTLFGRKKGLK